MSWPAAVQTAYGRARAQCWPVLQSAIAAALAWYLAHDLLGHREPFFAPIAAAIALSNSHVQRARRTLQMVGGVLLGIGVSELMRPLVGNSTAAIFVVVLVTMLIAVAVGAGFFGEGMMFVNQAAASAILVVALHRAGTGSERAVDALVGGAAALLVGVLLFPADPRRLLAQAEAGVFGCLHEVLTLEPEHPEERVATELHAGRIVHAALGRLTQARLTARASVRVAPRRMPLRASVDAEIARASRLYLLAASCLGLHRTALEAQAGVLPRDAQPGAQGAQTELAGVLLAMSAAPPPWGPAQLSEPLERLGALAQALGGEMPPGVAVARAAARRAARDLIGYLEAGRG